MEKESCDICLPFAILTYYMKNAKHGMLSENEKALLDGLIVLCFNSLSIDSKFVCYIINESDFIEILMADITEAIESLPGSLEPKDILGNFSIYDQIEDKNELMLTYLQSLMTTCKLLHQIFVSLDV